MSTIPATDLRPHLSPWARRLSPPQTAWLAAGLAVLGLCSLRSTIGLLWYIWTTDALKSIGMLIPVVSFVLIMRAWRTLEWEMEGSWWGLAILVAAVGAVQFRERAILILVLSPQWNIYLPPHSLVAFGYTAGVVLLFGGTRLFRAALFPIALMWFVNPIPHIFNVLVDLPLQRVSAHVARAFAMALGQPLSPDQMRLMFTPSYGMFIAPGCNGIRGAVTMGFVALVAGYVCRFRWKSHAAVVAGAVLLGYVFNFARLCLLVIYYIIGLHLPRLQNKAKLADYIIGACLFLLATQILFFVIQKLGSKAKQPDPQPGAAVAATANSAFFLRFRLAVMAVIAFFGCYGTARAVIHDIATDPSQTRTSATSQGVFPEHIGTYTLVRTWNENLVTGPLLFHWAEYAAAGEGTHISVGVSPEIGSHDTLICHSARGEDPLWKDQLNISMANKQAVSFSASLYNNGAIQYLEATTICSGSHCGEYSSDRRSFGLVYSKPDTHALLSQDPQRSIPILLKAETLDTRSLPEDAQKQLSADIKNFLGQTDLDVLVGPYRR
ncbi:MAG: exosortase J [Acidobacteria bacterium]|nr:exosortase J [Acidobacteriota bacterium]